MGAITLFLPLFLLIASSSLWLGKIDIVEPFPAKEQSCTTDYDCVLVDRECGKYSCDHPISEINLEKYYELKEAVCMRPKDLHADIVIRRCDNEAYCNFGVCSARPITSVSNIAH